MEALRKSDVESWASSRISRKWCFPVSFCEASALHSAESHRWNNKATLIFFHFSNFTLNRSLVYINSSEWCQTLLRVWIRDVHYSLVTLRRRNGCNGRDENKMRGISGKGPQDTDFCHVRIHWTHLHSLAVVIRSHEKNRKPEIRLYLSRASCSRASE